jgi:hypothetical protein
VLGAVLLIPGLMWARRKARANPNTPAAKKVTKSGFVIAAIVVSILFTGFSAQFWASDTAFGQWMSTDTGRLIYAATIVAASVIIERLLYLVRVRISALAKRNDV